MKNTLSGLVTKSKVSNRLLLVLVVVSMVPLFFVSRTLFISIAQTNDKKEKKFTKETFKNEPIEFIELKSNGKKFKLNEKLTQEDDWLKDFTINFKNISDKPITYVSIIINFPETRSNGLPMSYIIKFGVHPDFPNKNNDELKMVAPNEIAQISLSPERYEKVKAFLATRHHLLRDLTEANVTIQTIFFADGANWFGGTISRPDPNRPGKYIIVDENH
jgi:hypothetical protein